jgi:hypothetical protein
VDQGGGRRHEGQWGYRRVVAQRTSRSHQPRAPLLSGVRQQLGHVHHGFVEVPKEPGHLTRPRDGRPLWTDSLGPSTRTTSHGPKHCTLLSLVDLKLGSGGSPQLTDHAAADCAGKRDVGLLQSLAVEYLQPGAESVGAWLNEPLATGGTEAAGEDAWHLGEQ